MKRNCFNVWQRRGPKLVPAPACMLATLTTMLGIPGISTAQKLKLPFTPKSPSQGYKIGTKHYSQHYKCQVCMTTKAMTWACNRLFRAFLQGTYYKLASHLNMATVSDLSRSAMLTPRPVSCSAWYNFASSVWDSSGCARVGGRVRAKAHARGVHIHTQTHTALSNLIGWFRFNGAC